LTNTSKKKFNQEFPKPSLVMETPTHQLSSTPFYSNVSLDNHDSKVCLENPHKKFYLSKEQKEKAWKELFQS
jgi:hypothetical protein